MRSSNSSSGNRRLRYNPEISHPARSCTTVVKRCGSGARRDSQLLHSREARLAQHVADQGRVQRRLHSCLALREPVVHRPCRRRAERPRPGGWLDGFGNQGLPLLLAVTWFTSRRDRGLRPPARCPDFPHTNWRRGDQGGNQSIRVGAAGRHLPDEPARGACAVFAGQRRLWRPRPDRQPRTPLPDTPPGPALPRPELRRRLPGGGAAGPHLGHGGRPRTSGLAGPRPRGRRARATDASRTPDQRPARPPRPADRTAPSRAPFGPRVTAFSRLACAPGWSSSLFPLTRLPDERKTETFR